jgi:large subunit ribosomal protein L1
MTTKISKRYKAERAKVTPGKPYSIDDALKLVKEGAKAKFNESVDVAIRLGIDAKKSDQGVRGSVMLPHGTGKTVRVAVFVPAGEKAEAAKAAGADVVTAVKNAKAGQVKFRNDKAGIVHCTIGKANFEVNALKENLHALLADLLKAKPASAKGNFLQKVSVSSTMGVGVIVDQASVAV